MRVMATNTSKNVPVKPGECTEFQLHKSQQMIFNGIRRKIYDYSEHRLRRHIETIKDAQQKMILVALLHDYIVGSVAIAWRRGQPIWVKVTKA